MKRENQIRTAFTLIRELDYIKGIILAQIQDELQRTFDEDKQKQPDKKQADIVF